MFVYSCTNSFLIYECSINNHVYYVSINLTNFSDASGLIKYWHIATCEALHTFKEKRELLAGAIDPTFSYLAAGGTANENYVYELATGNKLKVYGAR